MSAVLTSPTPAQLAKECDALNRLEADLAKCPPVDHPETHRFTPGLYSRQILLKAGILCTSKIHRTEHQFIISKGKCRIWSEEKGWETLQAPYHGITKPGTRRALHILEDVIFTTFHATTKTDLAEIEADLIEPDARLEELRQQQAGRALA
jgi:hypothetical protein